MARPAKSPAPFSLSVVPKTTNTNILLSAKPFYDLADSNNYKILDYVPRILVFSLFENYSALSSAGFSAVSSLKVVKPASKSWLYQLNTFFMSVV